MTFLLYRIRPRQAPLPATENTTQAYSAKHQHSATAQSQQSHSHHQIAAALPPRNSATTTPCAAKDLCQLILTWRKATTEDIEEYLVINEDVDAPFGGEPNVHGIYCLVPASTTSLSPGESDLEKVDNRIFGAKDEGLQVRSVFRVGKNKRNVVHIPCRPPLGHGALNWWRWERDWI